MLTQTFQVFNLRGIDQRWVTEPFNALFIQDMTWNSNDSWSTSGGWFPFFYQSPYYHGSGMSNSGGIDASDPSDTGRKFIIEKYVFPHVRSMHWFSQHNGARQFIVYEQQTWNDAKKDISDDLLELRYFDGSRSFYDSSLEGKKEPSRLMVKFKRKNERTAGGADNGEGLSPIDDRSDPGLCVPTQYQAWGNRLYILNGYQEPIVFNGEYSEVAGFRIKPSTPNADHCHWLDSATFPVSIGDTRANYLGHTKTIVIDGEEVGTVNVPGEDVRVEGGYWRGRFEDLPFSGMGGGSFARYKNGKYRPSYLTSEGDYWNQELEASGSTSAKDTDEGPRFKDNNVLKFALRFNKQMNRRRVGWKYKVTFVNERGHESDPSDASPVTRGLNGTGEPNHHGKIMLALSVPRGPSECVARRIYRTRNLFSPKGKNLSRGKAERYYFLKEIQDNMTEKWVDHIPDSSLGSLLSTRQTGPFPTNARFIASFKNTMFVSGETDNQIRFSLPNFPETFPTRNKINISDSDGGPVTGIRATKNALVVFKARGIYLIKGDANKGFFAQTLTQDVGMIAPNSVREVPGLGLMFLSDKGIYLLEGALENTGTITNIVKVSTEIPDIVQTINSSASVRSVGILNEADNEYWLAVPTNGSTVNNLLLVYHYLAGSWSTRKNFPISCGVSSKDHRSYVFFGIENENNTVSPSPTNMGRTSIGNVPPGPSDRVSRFDLENIRGVGIGFYSKGYFRKGDQSSGHEVDPIYKTPNQPFGTVFTSVHPAHVFAYGVGYGNNDMALNYTVNRSVFEVRKKGQNVDQQDPNERYPVYGKAKFNIDHWGEYRPTVLRFDVSTTHKGPVREFGVTFAKAEDSPSGTKIEIIGYDIEAKVGEQRKIKPLNELLKPDRR